MNKMVVSVSPHINSDATTAKIMLDVIIALIPASVASVILFGLKSLYIILACIVSAVLSEYIFNRICKRKNTIGDLSAIVTALLLALNLPASVPLWQVVFGAFVAIIAVKCLFGGIGQNFANPAITARIIMLISFSSTGVIVIPDIVDTVSSSTPLSIFSSGEGTLPSLADMFFGLRGGAIGETCILALLIGGIYLIFRGVISWHTPVFYIGTVFILSIIIGYFTGMDSTYPVYQIMSGGLFIGAIYMATDYSTTPFTPMGKIVFGIGCGIITMIIRVWGSYPEGVSFAILFMNILTPFINKFTRRRIFGVVK